MGAATPRATTSKKGVSASEKRTRMLDLLHESKDFFVLKELEKLASKSKGIVPQSVKEVLQELKDDRLIEVEKIGTSNYYWSFPYTATAAKQAALASRTAELDALGKAQVQAEKDLQGASQGREESDTRTTLLKQHADLGKQQQDITVDLARYGAVDPTAHEQKLRAVEVARAEACKWTENTLVVLQYIKAQSGMTDAEVRDQLGLSETWEDGYC